MDIPADAAVTYTIHESGTQRGKPRLTDSLGYSYAIKTKTSKRIRWICSVRSYMNQRCYAAVIQEGQTFTMGAKEHIHPAEPGATNMTQVTVALKKQAREQVYHPAMTLVDNAMLQLPPDAHQLPKPLNLKRTANRVRQAMRPADPRDLDFQFDKDHTPPDFLQKELHNVA